MELQEAVEKLTETRNKYEKHIKILEETNVVLKKSNFYEVLGELRAEFEAIDTVLKELERIEPKGNIIENIKEIDILEMGDSQNIDNLGLANSIVDLRNVIRETQHKLNEVIRRINNVR